MFKWLFENTIKEQINKELTSLNEILSKSFSNIKKDMDNLRNEINKKNTPEKFSEFEQKLGILDDKILSVKASISSVEQTEEINKDLTHTQQKILLALYELQKRIGQAISTKSLAKFIYNGRNYGSVRSTLSSYLEVLEENNLITKNKLGKESYSEVTDKGKEYVISHIKKKDIKKKLKAEQG